MPAAPARPARWAIVDNCRFVDLREILGPSDLHHFAGCSAVDDRIVLFWAYDLVLAGMRPVAWVGDDSGSHHIDVDLSHAAPEMLAASIAVALQRSCQ